MDWHRLEETPELFTLRYQQSQTLPSTKAAVPDPPHPRTVHYSMLAIKQWLHKADAQIYTSGLEHLVKVAGRRNILLPNHPHLFDSIASRYALYLSGHFVPRVAAIDNLKSVPVVNKIIQDNGAFFIDVKRFSDVAYRQEINDYMCRIADSGEWLQFYPEGGRAPTERQRILRHGLIKGVTDKPCAFFPISISYEKVISGLFSNVGRIYLRFHEAILYDPQEDLIPLVRDLSVALQKGVNLYTTDVLAAVALNHEPGSSISIKSLEDDVDWLQAVLVSREVEYVGCDLRTALKYLRLKVDKRDDHVVMPLTGSEEWQWVQIHRERILHLLVDLASPPPFLQKEFAWKPPTPLVSDEKLKAISSSAVAPLISEYSRLVAFLDEGVTNVKELVAKVSNSVITKSMVYNTLRVLKEQGVLSMEKGEVKLH